MVDLALDEGKQAPEKRGARTSARDLVTLGALILAFLAVTGLHNVLHPIWEAPEEPHHYAFIRYVAENRAIPQPEEHVTGRTGGENETHQTPLYYLIQALLVGWVDDGTEVEWHRNPYATWPDHPARHAVAVHRQEEAFPYQGYVLGVHLARLVSSLLAAAAVVTTYAIGRRVTGRHALALGAAGLAAFTPGFAFLSAAVSNDNGVVLASSLVLLHCLALVDRRRVTWRDGVLSGALLGVATLMKLSGLQLAAVVALAWGVLFFRTGRRSPRTFLAAIAPLPVVFLALTAWWPLAIRDRLHIVLYSSAIAGSVGESDTAGSGFSPEHVWSALGDLFRTYWGAFGWTNDILLPDWLYVVLLAAMALALAGLLRHGLSGASRRQAGFSRAGLALLGFHAVVTVLVVVVRNEQMPLAGVDDGRFLYPAIAAFAVLLVVGLSQLARRGEVLVAALVAGLALASLSVPLTKSQQAFPPPVQAWGIFDEARVQQRLDLSWQNGVTLLGLSGMAGERQPGDSLDLTAYWRSDEDRATDMRPVFRAVDPNGEVAVSDHTMPQEDEFPPRFWQRGEVVLDPRRLMLPSSAVPGLYTLQVLVVNVPGESHVPLLSGAEGWQDVASFRVRPAAGPGPAVTLAQQPSFGGEIALAGYSTERTGTAGDELCLTLFWRATSEPGEDYHVSVQILDAEGKLRGQHDGVPYEGLYPASRWETGETVPDRHCLSVGQLPAGSYRLVVVVYRPADGSRLAVEPGGNTYLELTQLPL